MNYVITMIIKYDILYKNIIFYVNINKINKIYSENTILKYLILLIFN